MTISGMAPCSLTYSFVTRRTRLNLAKSLSAPAGDEKIRSGGMARVLIGTSGWHYDSWRGPFYPKGAMLKGLLRYYASQFQTTEPNGVFYRTPTSQAVATWRADTGKDFVFAGKASKFITHWKRLSPVDSKARCHMGFLWHGSIVLSPTGTHPLATDPSLATLCVVE